MRYGILLMSIFLAFNITFIPREANQLADSLAVATSTFKIPHDTKINYEVQLKCRPAILDNVRDWKYFEDDREIIRFMERVE